MPDKLTDKEIVKALKSRMYKENKYMFSLLQNALDLINRLQAERDAWKETAETSEKAYEEWHRVAELNAMKIIELQAENEVLKARIGVYETCNARKDEAIRGLKAENERLNIRLRKERDQFADIGKMYSEVKAEAYKECIAKVKEEIKQALESNYKAKHEHIEKHYQCLSCDFLATVRGKIDALSGLDYFLDNFLKELEGDSK